MPTRTPRTSSLKTDDGRRVFKNEEKRSEQTLKNAHQTTPMKTTDRRELPATATGTLRPSHTRADDGRHVFKNEKGTERTRRNIHQTTPEIMTRLFKAEISGTAHSDVEDDRRQMFTMTCPRPLRMAPGACGSAQRATTSYTAFCTKDSGREWCA